MPPCCKLWEEGTPRHSTDHITVGLRFAEDLPAGKVVRVYTAVLTSGGEEAKAGGDGRVDAVHLVEVRDIRPYGTTSCTHIP